MARDDRFTDPWNQGVNAEAFLYDEAKPARAKALMMLYKRLREIDVPEMMAGIITQTPGKPWGYYRDMSRQLWDEARHAFAAALDDLAAKLAAASSQTGDQAAQQAIDTAVAGLSALSGNLSAAIAKDDPAPAPAPAP